MGWQDAVAISAVFGALFYLSSLGWRGLVGGRGGSCGTSCGKCSSAGDGQAEQLVSIGLKGVGAGGKAAAFQDREA